MSNELKARIEKEAGKKYPQHREDVLQGSNYMGYMTGAIKYAERVEELEADLVESHRFLDEMRRNADEVIKRVDARIAAYQERVANPEKFNVDLQTVEFVLKEAEKIREMLNMI